MCKKLWVCLILMLLLSLSFGIVTFADFTDTSDEVINTFTLAEVDDSGAEIDWSGSVSIQWHEYPFD